MYNSILAMAVCVMAIVVAVAWTKYLVSKTEMNRSLTLLNMLKAAQLSSKLDPEVVRRVNGHTDTLGEAS